jgi:hypothetical protein
VDELPAIIADYIAAFSGFDFKVSLEAFAV